jgi:glycosyltransferase involved in cell wall biosynthesis
MSLRKHKPTLAYIYFNSLTERTANVVQTLNVINNFAYYFDVVFVSSWISRSAFSHILRYQSVRQNFRLIRNPIILSTHFMFFEYVTRFIYVIASFLHIKLRQFDVVYTRDFSFLLFYSYLPTWLRFKCPIVFEAHTIYHQSSAHKVSFRQEQRAFEVVTKFIAISKGIQGDLSKMFNIPNERIGLFPDGVDLENISQTKVDEDLLYRRYSGINPKDIIVVYAGSFKLWKGVDILVSAAKYITNSHVKILLVGGVGEDFQRIKRLVQSLHVGETVILDTYVDQKTIWSILSSAHIAIIPNINTAIGAKYTSPLKLFEYMAFGLPIIASRVPALQELLDEGKQCLFVEPGNAEQVAHAIEKLATSSHLREDFSVYNREKVNRYDWRVRAKGIHAFIVDQQGQS